MAVPAPLGAGTVPPFDQVAVAVAPGDDLVVRMPGIVLVVSVRTADAPAPSPAPRLGGWGAPPVAAPQAAPVGHPRVGELVDLCRAVSAAGSRAPGRRLQDEVRAWLSAARDLPSFALAAATEEGLALGLVGRGVAEVPDLGLRLTSADGERLPDGTAVLARLVDWPPAALRLSAGAPIGTAPHPLADLEAGAVPGAAAVLSSAPAPARPAAADAPPATTAVRLPAPGAAAGALAAVPPPRTLRKPGRSGAPGAPVVGSAPVAPHPDAGPGDEHGHGSPPAPPAVPEPQVELPPPARAVSLLAPPPPEEAEPPRAPLPVVSGEQPPAAVARDPEDGRPRVKGFLCSRGHLNDPRVQFCALCGVRMAQQTGVLTDGVRPPLGLLVFDDGATVSLDADYLLGREPETDERVRAGAVRPLLVVDPTGGVSRHHAEIRLEGWDVVLVDTGSANGTLVAPRGAPAWSSLVPGQPVQLTPGMAVRMGSRSFAFESPHGGY
ncbi:FHA domain-containing protein [Geodermatophilus marinus]|uniref:FHA domain-containing protein n=1 Tax=Geodermatophilus sp. LHW52908 TaxID=2303986 RepID=UPI000E3B7523|nr:FHA domain-containing protein [Geodermatophilus sp. LHW52908]RFU20667.1 FHA domain-containing protein [Geodermatophilus sp. LHW52908]